MKIKNKLVLITILLISFQTMFAQGEHSLGQAPGFVKSERVLPHYQEGNTLVNTGYGVDLSNPIKFVSMPIPAGTPLTTINDNFGNYYIGGADINNSGNYYVCTQNAPGFSELWQVDLSNGIPTFITGITGFSYYTTSLAYNSANSTWYLGSSNIAESRLYTLNIATGSVTYIGQITGLAGLMSLAINCDGNAYGIDLVSDQLFLINLSTGAGTPIGPLGFDANFAQDADFDAVTNILYLAAFNDGTFQGEFRSVDLTTGSTTFITAWPGSQITGFAIDNTCGPPCPVGAPSNPNPPNGATYVPVYGTTVSWTNGVGTANIELWFGPIGNVVKVYDGPAVNQYVLPALNYSTTYAWYIVCKDAICGTQGPTWSFTTEQYPGVYQWCDEFANLSNWTVIGPQGLTNWSTSSSSSAGGSPPELRFSWTPSFNGDSKIRSNAFPLYSNQCCYFSFNFYFDWYAEPSGTVTVGITYDAGVTSSPIYCITNPTGNVGPLVFSTTFGTTSTSNQYAQIEITYSGNSFNTDNIYWDNVCVSYLASNMCRPGAPGNLVAQVMFDPGPKVQLGWQDNTWNEAGFNVLRKNGQPNDPGDYVLVGTVGQNQTQFIDATVAPESTYTYRVFAYNQYGQNGSNTATIAVPVPVELISFIAEVDGNLVTLFWQTATETNNLGFEILRSAQNDSEDWERIGFVEGKGTTTEIQSYSFIDKPEPGIYKYRLKQIDYDGSFAYSPEVEVEAEVKAPNVFSLEQNYPNPFNPSTKIKYQIPNVIANEVKQSQLVTLKVYDILGNEVTELVNEEQAPGDYEVEFSAKGGSASGGNTYALPSGIYFYQLKTGSFVETKKMILLK